MKPNKKKYLVVFIITSGIFLVVFMFVSFLNAKKTNSINQLQQKITVDLLATETQFSLLTNAPCKALGNSILSQELGEMGEKLSFMESTQSKTSDELIQLKKYYSLLQVKDYLLMEEVAQKCDIETDSIIYFYEQECSDCIKQGYVLTELKKQYPWLRIYSFDRNLDFALIDTFEGLYALGTTFPALIIGGDTYSGFHDIQSIEGYIPELQKRKVLENIKTETLQLIADTDTYVDYKGEFVFLGVDDGQVTIEYIPTQDEHGDTFIITLEQQDGDNWVIVNDTQEDKQTKE